MSTERTLTEEAEQASAPAEIAIFIPPAEDSSCVVVNELVREIVKDTDAVNVVIFTVEQKPDPRILQSRSLEKRHVLHQGLLSDVVFPFQEEWEAREGKTNPEGILLSPKLLAAKYSDRVRLEDVPDPNAPEFVASIRDNPNMQMGFSVRNLVLFEQPIIDAFKQDDDPVGRLINIHPARLPGIRGLNGPFWTRMEDERQGTPHNKKHYVTTMHVIDAGIDTGPVLDRRITSINGHQTKSVGEYTRDVAPEIAKMIAHEAVAAIVSGERRPPTSHTPEASIYRTTPTEAEIQEGERLHINFNSRDTQLAWLPESFADVTKDKDHHAELNGRINEWYYCYKWQSPETDNPYRPDVANDTPEQRPLGRDAQGPDAQAPGDDAEGQRRLEFGS